MADPSAGDYFITDLDSDSPEDDESMPLVVPVAQMESSSRTSQHREVPADPPVVPSDAPEPGGSLGSAGAEHGGRGVEADVGSAPEPPETTLTTEGLEPALDAAGARPAPVTSTTSAETSGAPRMPAPGSAVRVAPAEPSREDLLVSALDDLMEEDTDIQAAALVSLDGFTMASALPAEMQSDRVGAMSAAILALGERAAAELGRGRLSQVFIEGEDGYVFLIAAGSWAVLTAITDPSAKLGLVIYDMKKAAERIGEILG